MRAQTFKTNTTTAQSTILIVEGKEDEAVIRALLETMPGFQNQIQIIDGRGKDNFPGTLDELQTTRGFFDVKTIAFIRDADYGSSSESAFVKSCREMRKTINEFTIPQIESDLIHGIDSTFFKQALVQHHQENLNINFGFFILPDHASAGMLETLCLESIRPRIDVNTLKCIDSYSECLQSTFNDHLEHDKFKARIHLAALKINNASITSILSMKDKNNKYKYIDFQDNCWSRLKDFLNELIGFFPTEPAISDSNE